MRKIILFVFVVIFAPRLVFGACGGSSPNLVAADATYTEVAACVSDSVDGDTITIPAGTETWASQLSWSNKNINLIGNGPGSTVISTSNGTNAVISVTATSKASFRISGLTINLGEGNDKGISVVNGTNASGTYGWRIDNVAIAATAASDSQHPFYIRGITWGVIDNSTINMVNGFAVELYGYLDTDTVGGDADWNLALDLGTYKAVYLENSTVNFAGNNAAICDIWTGGALVLRHNTITNTGATTSCANFQTHANRGASARGGRKYEFYRNALSCSSSGGAAGLIRSGTGVIFSNSISGYPNSEILLDNQRTCHVYTTRCDGGDATRDGNTEGEYGWPCADQIGRTGGTLGAQSSTPLYAWDNGSVTLALNADWELCSTNAPPALSTHIKTSGDASPHAGNVADYVDGVQLFGYIPYTCPHSLTGLTGTCTDTPGLNGYNVAIAASTRQSMSYEAAAPSVLPIPAGGTGITIGP